MKAKRNLKQQALHALCDLSHWEWIQRIKQGNMQHCGVFLQWRYINVWLHYITSNIMFRNGNQLPDFILSSYQSLKCISINCSSGSSSNLFLFSLGTQKLRYWSISIDQTKSMNITIHISNYTSKVLLKHKRQQHKEAEMLLSNWTHYLHQIANKYCKLQSTVSVVKGLILH